jgi:hypothetical protein
LNDWKWVTLYLDYIDSKQKKKREGANKEEPKEKSQKRRAENNKREEEERGKRSSVGMPAPSAVHSAKG